MLEPRIGIAWAHERGRGGDSTSLCIMKLSAVLVDLILSRPGQSGRLLELVHVGLVIGAL